MKRVEEELRRVGRVLDEHSSFREALQVQLEEQGRAWRREAEELARRVEQLREQLTKTMEAALWSGSEVAAVRKELKKSNTFGLPLDSFLLEIEVKQLRPCSLAHLFAMALFGAGSGCRDPLIQSMEKQINSVCRLQKSMSWPRRRSFSMLFERLQML